MPFTSLQPPKCPAQYSMHSKYSTDENKMEGERERYPEWEKGERTRNAQLICKAKRCTPVPGWQSRDWPHSTLRRGGKPTSGSHLETTGTPSSSLQVAACLDPALRDFPKPLACYVVGDSKRFLLLEVSSVKCFLGREHVWDSWKGSSLC